ncbi:MAG: sialidase family protein [bacterium]
MRASTVAVILLASVMVGGCTSPPNPRTGPDLLGWRLDCGLGLIEAATDPAWLQDCEARASHTVGPKQEIWLAVNPTDSQNVVLAAKDNNPASSAACVWNGVFVTHDAGAHWKDVTIGGRYSDRKPGELWYGYACNTDPMFRFGADGQLHYAVEMYNLGGTNSHGPGGPSPQTGRPYIQPGWRLVLATSKDGGDTWPTVVELVDGDGTVDLNDYSRMAISPKTGTIIEAIGLLSGTDFTLPAVGAPPQTTDAATHSYCWVTASEDHGASARTPVAVVQNPPQGIACQAIAVSPEGVVVLGGEVGGSAVGGKEGSGHFSFATSTDDGKSFGAYAGGFDYVSLPGHFNNTRFRTGTNIEMVYDLTTGPRHGRLYAIYSDFSRGDADILLRTSKDDGATWSQAVRVNDGGDGSDQFMPNMAVAGDGSLHAFWMDRKHDPQGRLIGITHAVSLDGEHWQEERVTSVSWDGDLGVHQEGFPFIGDYLGVDAVGNDVWGGFPDASNGATTVVAAAHVVKA